MTARYLIDKSALARMSTASVKARLAPIIEAGEAATCGIIDLEVLYSARNAQDHESIRRRRSLAYTWVPMTDADFTRAMDVQGQLALSGHHRLPIPDLLVAAVAERAGLTVIHYDRDFDTIAETTGQAVEWVVPRGSLK